MKVKDYYTDDNGELIINIDISKLENIMLADVDPKDAMDFADVYIESADYNGKPLTEDELEWVMENGGSEIAQSQAFGWLL